jgi:bifunctional ADP-heptose synthase (sugar kinase/adenylyltransferase)
MESDITGNINLEVESVNNIGGKIHFTSGVTNSSSSIINEYLLDQTEESQIWINKYRSELLSQINEAIIKISKLKVVIIGELIIDEYRFTQALGKVSKQPILAHQELFRKVYGGGSLAIARHIETFAKSTKLITLVGEDYNNNFSNFVNDSLGAIKIHLVVDVTRPTVRKIRYIDQNSNSHVFEKYVLDDSFVNAKVQGELIDLINREVNDCDLILISDFGHGMFDPQVAAHINNLPSRKLCINVQANAGNGGKNTINKFPSRLMASLNGSELELLLRQTGMDFKSIVNQYLKSEGAENLVVTHGNKGLAIRSGEETIEIPAFATNVVDKVGAGDAVFAISALFFGVNATLPANALASSLAGAMNAKSFGNSVPLNLKDFQKAIRHII